MPKALPFRALRPSKEGAYEIACLPFDALTESECREIQNSKPNTFLKVSRSEINFPEGVSPYSPEVYEKAGEVLKAYVGEGLLKLDSEPNYTVYEQAYEGHLQTGIACLFDREDYLSGAIKRHEKTLPEKEKDRIEHFKACKAQTEPLFFVYRPNAALKALLGAIKEAGPDISFTDDYGCTNRLWAVPASYPGFKEALLGMGGLYIADGHHRAASSAKAGDGNIMAVAISEEDVYIQGYHRLVSSIEPYESASFIEKLAEKFDCEPSLSIEPKAKHEIGVFLDGKSYIIKPKKGTFDEDGPVSGLDCSIVQMNIFDELLGIKDPATDKRLTFIGGAKGFEYLENEVIEGRATLAVAIFPVKMSDIMSVSDADLTMPPKSTWFEPKLRSGLFIYPY